MSKYLFIGSHVDDFELSCGGTIVKLIEQGHSVTSLAFTFCDERNILDEYLAAGRVLGIRNDEVNCESFDVRCFNQQSLFIADKLMEFRDYDFVFTHSDQCRHPDHRTVGQESKRIFNGNLITYMQPWNGQHEENFFVDLSESQLETKIKALACYKSQAHRSYMSPDFIRSQARYNGIKCGKLYAEAFKVVRLVQ